jgi:hypothetical protein
MTNQFHLPFEVAKNLFRGSSWIAVPALQTSFRVNSKHFEAKPSGFTETTRAFPVFLYKNIGFGPIVL